MRTAWGSRLTTAASVRTRLHLWAGDWATPLGDAQWCHMGLSGHNVRFCDLSPGTDMHPLPGFAGVSPTLEGVLLTSPQLGDQCWC